MRHTEHSLSVGIELPTQLPITTALKTGLHELGVDWVNYYVRTTPRNVEDPMAVNRAMLALARELELTHALSCYVLDPPDEAIAESAREGAAFAGVICDELLHSRLLHSHSPTPLADPSGWHTLDQAYAETLESLTALRQRLQDAGAPAVAATHVWPVLVHLTARAGYIVCPKLCKELYSSVSLAIGLGAALQYRRPLWADVDLWCWSNLPGHGPDEIFANLQLAHALGVQRVYLEGAGFNLLPAGEQGTPFSLLNLLSEDRASLTPHGQALRRFTREYVPRRPRPYRFTDVAPDVAIVRFPDSCYGQRWCTIFPETAGLYGSPHLPSTPETEAWLQIWNLLTFGATGEDGITWFKTSVAEPSEHLLPQGAWGNHPLGTPATSRHRFFTPLHGAVVYDHTVGYEPLRDVPLIFLTGASISRDTLGALRRRLEEGATLVAWGPLAHRSGLAPRWDGGTSVQRVGAGKLVITGCFSDQQTAGHIMSLRGRSDEIRYRFRRPDQEYVVTLRNIDDNQVTAECPGWPC